MAKLNRFVFWIMMLARYGSGSGVYFLFEGPWSTGIGCLTVLFFWKLNMLQDRLNVIHSSLRGFSDDDMYEALRKGDAESLKTKGLLQEVVKVLLDIRNNQTNAPPRGDGGNVLTERL